MRDFAKQPFVSTIDHQTLFNTSKPSNTPMRILVHLLFTLAIYMCCGFTMNSFLLLISLGAAICSVGFCIRTSDIPCHDSERQALLSFKRHLTDPSRRLASWVGGGNCCDWDGVVCHNLTGHVRELHLGNPINHEYLKEYQAYKRLALGGKINTSLLGLKHLRYLDLSNNDFGGIQVPKFFGSLWHLRYLNLSSAGFGGEIPHQLGNLTKLRYLDIGYQYNCYAENLQWLSGISMLQYLDLSYLNFNGTSHKLQGTISLPFLEELYLSQCELYHIPLLPQVNSSNLVKLDLSGNHILGTSLFIICGYGLDSLVFLDLSYNSFDGPILSCLGNLTSLKYLHLSSCGLNSTLPRWFYKFSKLEKLDLGRNSLQGMISEDIANLTHLNYLDLSHNENLHGKIPAFMRTMCNLQWLDLSYVMLMQKASEALNTFVGCASNSLRSLSLSGCKLFGPLLDELEQFRNLKNLDLSTNQLNETLPNSIGSLTSLIQLDLSENQFSETLSEVFFVNLTRLQVLRASRNSIILKVSPDWIPPFQLREMKLSSWNLGSEFPKWLSSLNLLQFLDISNTSIEDTIPGWFWKMSSQFIYMNLSHNQLYGQVSDKITMSDFAAVDLSSNCFTGPLPRLSSGIYELLDLSHNQFFGPISRLLCDETNETKDLEFLHLGNNNISGEIPDCWNSWPFMYSIELQNNNLIGNLPRSMGLLSRLHYLHLRNNTLSGVLPSVLQNCTKLLVLDLCQNKLGGSLPRWIGQKLSDLRILSLRSNDFEGYIPNDMCNLTYLSILDLADNNLSGTIPKCMSNLGAMTNLSSFKFPSRDYDGLICTKHVDDRRVECGPPTYDETAILVTKALMLEYGKNLIFMTAIDLSDNSLSGRIPENISNLIDLKSFNLSRNYLSGKIPENVGNMKSLESLDLSFNKISGVIPPSMAQITSLEFLNLSFNHLSGRIPIGPQLQTFNASSFIGNNLCGPPISYSTTKGPIWSEQIEGRNHWGFDEFYVSMSLGFVVGSGVVVVPLLYCRSWRSKYFLWVQRTWDRLWVRVVLLIRAGFEGQA